MPLNFSSECVCALILHSNCIMSLLASPSGGNKRDGYQICEENKENGILLHEWDVSLCYCCRLHTARAVPYLSALPGQFIRLISVGQLVIVKSGRGFKSRVVNTGEQLAQAIAAAFPISTSVSNLMHHPPPPSPRLLLCLLLLDGLPPLPPIQQAALILP